MIKDDEGNKIGVAYTREEEGEHCEVAPGVTEAYRFTTQIMCDEATTAQGGAAIESVDASDPCHAVVVMKHSAGCAPPTAAEAFAVWLKENSWTAAIVGIILGAVFATLGKRWFPFIGATLAALGVLFTAVSVSQALQWTDTVLGLMLTLLLSMALAIVIGSLVRRDIWLLVGVTGVLGGFSVGVVIESLLLAVHFDSFIGYLIIVGLCGFIGGLLSFKFGGKVILFGTSFIGSYMFIRGWSLIFGGWPSEHEVWTSLREGEEVELEWPFYVYFTIFLVLFGLTSWWQYQKEKHHEDVQNVMDEDDNWKRAEK